MKPIHVAFVWHMHQPKIWAEPRMVSAARQARAGWDLL